MGGLAMGGEGGGVSQGGGGRGHFGPAHILHTWCFALKGQVSHNEVGEVTH